MSNEPKVTRFGADPTLEQELATKAYVDAGGGGGGALFARVVKTADESVVTSTVLQDDDELFVALNANKTYAFVLFLIINTNTSADFKAAFTHPAGSNGEWAETLEPNIEFFPLATSQSQGMSAGNDRSEAYMGRVIMGATPGNLQLQWAQVIANATTILRQGTILEVWEEI